MIIHLTADDIVRYWEQIKFAATSVNEVSPENMEAYCTNLLANLIAGDVQCFFGTSEERKDKLKAVILTRIWKDIGDIPHFLIDAVFGFSASTFEEKKEFGKSMKWFAKKRGCDMVFAWTFNDLASDALEKAGFEFKYKVYTVKT